MVKPITTKLKFFIDSGTKNFNPNKAAKEQTVVGPVKNGAGALMDQASIAPRGPSHREWKILVKAKFLNDSSFNELIIPQ